MGAQVSAALRPIWHLKLTYGTFWHHLCVHNRPTLIKRRLIHFQIWHHRIQKWTAAPGGLCLSGSQTEMISHQNTPHQHTHRFHWVSSIIFPVSLSIICLRHVIHLFYPTVPSPSAVWKPPLSLTSEKMARACHVVVGLKIKTNAKWIIQWRKSCSQMTPTFWWWRNNMLRISGRACVELAQNCFSKASHQCDKRWKRQSL